MLQDVEDARVVDGRRLEGDGKGLIAVIYGKPHCARPARVVAHDIGGACKLNKRLHGSHGEAGMPRSDRERRVGGGKVPLKIPHGCSSRWYVRPLIVGF